MQGFIGWFRRSKAVSSEEEKGLHGVFKRQSASQSADPELSPNPQRHGLQTRP
jgi:hypothetical protein